MISDHHAHFEVSDVTRGGARSFLRFYSMGSPGWGKKFGCQNFSLIILQPVIGHFFLVSPVLGHSGHSTMCRGRWNYGYDDNYIESNLSSEESRRIRLLNLRSSEADREACFDWK